jgi:hypothetical protein
MKDKIVSALQPFGLHALIGINEIYRGIGKYKNKEYGISINPYRKNHLITIILWDEKKKNERKKFQEKCYSALQEKINIISKKDYGLSREFKLN